MKFYLDSANLEEIREALSMGVISGVTTNPTLVAKEGVQYAQRLKEILALGVPEVSAQVTATDTEGMFQQGLSYSGISDMVVVKLPATLDGIRACRQLSKGCRCNVTLVFSPLQAVLAAEARASIVSVFWARTKDAGRSPAALFERTRAIYDRRGLLSKLLAASLRTTDHVLQAAIHGADIATVSLPLLKQCFHHKQTEEGLAKMLADYGATQVDWTLQTR